MIRKNQLRGNAPSQNSGNGIGTINHPIGRNRCTKQPSRGQEQYPTLHQRRKLGNGADGETRTLTELPPPDFESGASTNSATSAREIFNPCNSFMGISIHKQSKQPTTCCPDSVASSWLLRTMRLKQSSLGIPGCFIGLFYWQKKG